MILADKIIRLRKKNGWSQEELADKMGVSRQSVSKWEGALSVPDLDKILQLGNVFGVSTDFLLKDELEIEDYAEPANDPETPAVRRVTLKEANEFLAAKESTSKKIAVGVLMCILSPICLLILGAGSDSGMLAVSENVAGGVGVISLLVVVAAAVAVFITCAMKLDKYEFLEKEAIETEYGVSGMVREKMAAYADTYTRFNVIGTCICILAAVPLLTAAFLTENEFYIMLGLAGTLLLVSIGVYLFIVAGINHGAMQMLLQEGDYTKQAKHKNSKIGAFSTAYWLIAVAIYLGYSFYTEDWNSSWIVWPVAGVLFGAVSAVAKLFVKDDK